MVKISVPFFLVLFLAVGTAPTAPDASAHSLFNSAEQTIGDYRMQVATLPEFPQVGETSQILFRLTDRNLDEVDSFTMGVRIFSDELQVGTVPPHHVEGGHWQMDYIFESGGNHIFQVDVYDGEGDGDPVTYTFNMSTQSPFGYVFIIAITAGATMFAIVIGYIYLPRLLKRR